MRMQERTPPRPVVLALRWRMWEVEARRIAGHDDDRTARRWVALRHWYTTRPQRPE